MIVRPPSASAERAVDLDLLLDGGRIAAGRGRGTRCAPARPGRRRGAAAALRVVHRAEVGADQDLDTVGRDGRRRARVECPSGPRAGVVVERRRSRASVSASGSTYSLAGRCRRARWSLRRVRRGRRPGGHDRRDRPGPRQDRAVPGRAARGQHQAADPVRVELGHLGRREVVGDEHALALDARAPGLRRGRGPPAARPRVRRRRGPAGRGRARRRARHSTADDRVEPGAGRGTPWRIRSWTSSSRSASSMSIRWASKIRASLLAGLPRSRRPGPAGSRGAPPPPPRGSGATRRRRHRSARRPTSTSTARMVSTPARSRCRARPAAARR